MTLYLRSINSELSVAYLWFLKYQFRYGLRLLVQGHSMTFHVEVLKRNETKMSVHKLQA